MVLPIIILLLVAVGCFLLGLFTGAKIMEERHGKKLKELQGKLDELEKQLGTQINAVEQVNKLKEKVDARRKKP